jgi:hypothetical protein
MTTPEPRKLPRQARPLEGRIGYAGKYRLRCLILNISGSGAKLSLKRQSNLPVEFFLSISRRGEHTEYWARTIWRRGNTIGVIFSEPPAGSAPMYGLRRGRGAYQA